jgi:hypothetical protein
MLCAGLALVNWQEWRNIFFNVRVFFHHTSPKRWFENVVDRQEFARKRFRAQHHRRLGVLVGWRGPWVKRQFEL